MFIDEAKISVKAGSGGDGCASFRREKYKPHGGPDGGDGGNGGSVILKTDGRLRTLMDFYKRRHFKAEHGSLGRGNNRRGKDGENLVLSVPCGTVVKESGKVLADLVEGGEEAVVAYGGEGGRGNAAFTTPTRQAPFFAEKGERGEERWINLELKLLADVGIIGFPNVGKSTLIGRISKAKPKVASYPFTTKVPNLGVVTLGEEKNIIVADVPGLIEGAHEGKGLGDAFLRHVERTLFLVHLLDLSGLEGRDPRKDYEILMKELKSYSPSLSSRPQIVIGNKVDIASAKKNLARAAKYFAGKKVTFIPISALTGEGVDKLLHILLSEYKELEITRMVKPKKVHRVIEAQGKGFSITKEEGMFLVKGKTIERLVESFDLNNEEAVSYLQRQLEKIGLEKELVKAGAKKGDIVRIGEFEFDFIP